MRQLMLSIKRIRPAGLIEAAGIGGFQQRIKQHIAAGGEIVGFGVLDLVVADAADARHKDHGRRGDPCKVNGIMAGAADDVLMWVALHFGGVAHSADEVGVEWGRWEIPEFLDLEVEADLGRRGIAGPPELLIHCAEHRVIGMAEIHGEEHLSGDRIA